MTALDNLFGEVTALAHQLRRNDFHAQYGAGLLAAGRSVLQILAAEGPRTVPAIAARQNSSRQNVQVISNRFAEEGLVKFKGNPAHKKSELVEITEEGRAMLIESAAREREARRQLSLELEEGQIQAAAELLRRIKSSFQQEPARAEPADKAPPSFREVDVPVPEEIGEDGSLPVNLL